MCCPADLGEVKLEGIVGGQRDYQTSGEILHQRVAVVTKEQAVVAQWRHGNANLSQVVKILQHRGLEKEGRIRLFISSPFYSKGEKKSRFTANIEPS